MLRVAFGHKARCGKDTAASYMTNKYGGVVQRFASPLYAITERIQESLGSHVEKDPSLLQMIGETLKCRYGADVFARALETRLQRDTNIFISDLRFPEEATMLKTHGFILVNIQRDDRPIDRDPTHISEVSWTRTRLTLR